jgi:hypothetical protein
VSPRGPDASPEGLVAGPSTRAGPAAIDEPPDGRPGRVRWLVGPAGLLAGLSAFGIGEATYKWIPAQKLTYHAFGSKVISATAATQAVADVRNGALAFGVLGLCLGGCLGVAGGLARRSKVAAAGAGLLGSIVGAALAAGVAWATLGTLLDAQIVHLDYELPIGMAMHGLPWGLAGAAAGLAFAVGLGRWPRPGVAPLAGFLGAVLGAVAFDLLGAALFPFADTLGPISTTWPSRLMARLLVGLATAAALILSPIGPRPSHAARQPHSVTPQP